MSGVQRSKPIPGERDARVEIRVVWGSNDMKPPLSTTVVAVEEATRDALREFERWRPDGPV